MATDEDVLVGAERDLRQVGFILPTDRSNIDYWQKTEIHLGTLVHVEASLRDLAAALREARAEVEALREQVADFSALARAVVDGQLTETEYDRSIYRRGFRALLAKGSGD